MEKHCALVSFTQQHFNIFAEIIQTKSGLMIGSKKIREINSKLEIIINRFSSINSFIESLRTDNDLYQDVINKLTIGESYFFRNHPHFQALKEKIIPEIIEHNKGLKKINIWSAGCSTGEEPYSISIMLDKDFPFLKKWSIQILATDINTEYLKKAQQGAYGQWSFRGVDENIKNNYFTLKNKYLALAPFIKERVNFKKYDLGMRPFTSEIVQDKFDLILCRNVLIYFPNKEAVDICNEFSNSLQEEGYLIMGHSESYTSLSELEPVYSHATYYYRKNISKKSKKDKRYPLSLVPGIASYDPDKLISINEQKTDCYDRQKNKENFQKNSNNSVKRKGISGSPGLVFENNQNALEIELKKARDYALEGELKRADELLNQIEANEGALDYRVCFLKALIADQKNEAEESMVFLRRAIFINKEFVIGHYYQGVIAERSGLVALAKRSYKNVCALALGLDENCELSEGGGVAAGRIMEIASERLKELEMQYE